MNRKNMDKELLLAGSGELSRRQRKKLDSAVAGCPELQAKAQEITVLQALWKEATADTPPPSLATLERIRREAAASARPHRKPVVLLFRLPRLATAYAAAAAGVILAASLLTHAVLRAGSVNDNLDERIAEAIHDIDMSLLAVLDNLADNGNPPEVERDALALQLILMEDS